MNTVSVNCSHCHTENKAIQMRDGTYMSTCGNRECKRHMVVRVCVLTACPHCHTPITAFEQERPFFAKLPRMFIATCWNKDCQRYGDTYPVALDGVEQV